MSGSLELAQPHAAPPHAKDEHVGFGARKILENNRLGGNVCGRPVQQMSPDHPLATPPAKIILLNLYHTIYIRHW